MKKITTILTMYLFYISQIQFSFADDIELYQGGDTGIRPNIHFIMDTSKSMDAEIKLDKAFYDKDFRYPGPFRNDRYYFSELPESGAQNGFLAKLFDNPVAMNALLVNTIHPDSFRCDTYKGQMKTKGYAVGNFLQWDPDQDHRTRPTVFNNWTYRKGVWKTVRASENPNRYVECKSDQGKHGKDSSSNEVYATHDRDGEPYTSSGKSVPTTAFGLRCCGGSASRGFWGLIAGFALGATETIYSGNYLNYDFATSNGSTYVPRLYYMGQLLSDAVALYPGVNVSLSRFDGRMMGSLVWKDGRLQITPAPDGGMVAIASAPSEGNALLFENTIKSWDPWGDTPLTETYSEVVRYIKGENVNYGLNTQYFTWRGLNPHYEDYPSTALSRVNGDINNASYQTPMTETCQANHIIILSDGLPTNDETANPDIRRIIASDVYDTDTEQEKNCDGSGECADELAFHIANYDQFDDSLFDGTQTIRTHAIAGVITAETDADTDNSQDTLSSSTYQYLKKITDAGQGIAEEAKSADAVSVALNKIFGSILSSSVSFTAPVVSVNAFNSLELSDELYYSVFKPSKNLSWDGNIKQYKMGLHPDTKEFAVLDSRIPGQPAIDPDDGYFAKNSLSFWTSAEDFPEGDGPHVVDGGIAHHLDTNRVVYTSTSSGLAQLSSSNANKDQLGIPTKDADYHSKLLSWAHGLDAFDSDDDGNTTESRHRMQDPLHSEPTIITYAKGRATTSEDEDFVDRTMFVGTNGGFLHAFNIDKETPKEHFSFLPKELLHNLEMYHTGGGLLATKAYGVDGAVTHWHKDVDGNKVVNNGEKVYVFFGLRRGGHSYYALDVSDRSAPELLWEKHGPYPTDFPNKPAISPGFERMGQSWGRLEPATVKWNGQDKVVLFVSGGYDPAEDGDIAAGTHRSGPLARINHNIGNTVYMIDALSGEVLWDAQQHSGVGGQMTSSFPANVAPVDIKGNGYADVIYASDVGGRIWRFDINSSNTGHGDFASGRKVADLNSGSGAGNRRFYNEVDVIGSQDSDQILLSIGSGNRSHPAIHGAGSAQNYLFIIKDSLAPSSPGTRTIADLAEFPNSSPFGWYIPLNAPGEKVLARSNTVGDQILFSTFSPLINMTNSCDREPGYARAYKIDLTKATLQMADLATGGIPPMPMLIPPKRKGKQECDSAGVCEPLPPMDSSSEYSVLVGTEVVKFPDPVGSPYGSIFKDYWLER